MSAKGLHRHSLPLVVLAISLTTVLSIAVLAWRGQTTAQALLWPAVRVEPTDYGMAKIVSNPPPVHEVAGAFNEVEESKNSMDLSVVGQTGRSLELKLALDRAAAKVAQ